jgi:hypothetical protein
LMTIGSRVKGNGQHTWWDERAERSLYIIHSRRRAQFR